MDGGRISFEKQIFSGVPQVAEILALPALVRISLFEEGVPKYFFYRRYAADPVLSVIHLEGRSPCVRFGSDRGGMIVVDSASESVMHVSESRKRVSFVNTAVGKFTETALTLTERFPYGANFGGFEGAGAAADGIREIIRSIDVAAAVPGSYWPDFADEVDGHLYGMEEILEWYQSKLPFPSVADLADPEQGENNDSGDRL